MSSGNGEEAAAEDDVDEDGEFYQLVDFHADPEDIRFIRDREIKDELVRNL
jgi:hypothetical protein